MKRFLKKSALILCFLLFITMLASAWAGTPTPSVSPKPKTTATPAPKTTPTPKMTPTPKATSTPKPTPSATPTSTTPTSVPTATPSSASQTSLPKPRSSVRQVRAQVSFFVSDTGSVKTVLKSFYWISLPSGARRFDAALPPTAFRRNSIGKWVPSSDIVELARKLASRLFDDETAMAISYFGQYEPDIIRGEVRLTTGINEGIDFAATPQDAVFHSLTAGTVVKVVSSADSDELSYCAVRTDDAHTVFYANGISYFVKEGDAVLIGTPLGRQGDRGSRGSYRVHVSVGDKDAEQPAKIGDTKLTNAVPYSFWETWILKGNQMPD